MSGPKDTIVDVRRWYDMNGKRPVRNKTDPAEDTLAKKWSKLIKHKLNLSDELLAETDELQAQFDSVVDPLEAWMNEHKRPRGVNDLLRALWPKSGVDGRSGRRRRGYSPSRS